jgi:hypothetical protein
MTTDLLRLFSEVEIAATGDYAPAKQGFRLGRDRIRIHHSPTFLDSNPSKQGRTTTLEGCNGGSFDGAVLFIIHRKIETCTYLPIAEPRARHISFNTGPSSEV